MEESIRRKLLPRPDVFRRIKSISVKEDHENGGAMAVGTSYGDIAVFDIGTEI